MSWKSKKRKTKELSHMGETGDRTTNWNAGAWTRKRK